MNDDNAAIMGKAFFDLGSIFWSQHPDVMNDIIKRAQDGFLVLSLVERNLLADMFTEALKTTVAEAAEAETQSE